jgi:hypothetical protein
MDYFRGNKSNSNNQGQPVYQGPTQPGQSMVQPSLGATSPAPLLKQCILNCIAQKNASDRIYNKFKGQSTSLYRERQIRDILNEILAMSNLSGYTMSQNVSGWGSSLMSSSNTSNWNRTQGGRKRKNNKTRKYR